MLNSAGDTDARQNSRSGRAMTSLDKFDAFDLVTERAAISLLKLAGWITTVLVVIYGFWKSL